MMIRLSRKKKFGLIIFFITIALFWNLIALLLCNFFSIAPKLVEKEKILEESYPYANSNVTFLIGVSELIPKKNKTACSKFRGYPALSLIFKKLPLNFSSIESEMEEVFFKVTGKRVSQAKLVYLYKGGIKSVKIGNELIVHAIEIAGNESKYDFYLGTYDSGYLLGGLLNQGKIKYEIIDQVDKRIREMEVGDVDGDNSNEILVATHYDGITAIYYPKQNWKREIIDKGRYGENNTYNHKVEVGDINGDGINDIVSVLSQPNSWDKVQRGVIKLFVREGNTWKSYETKELERSSVRKVVLYPQEQAIFGGVGQRDEPEPRDASIIKYQFVNNSLRQVKETFFREARHNLYPFLVKGKKRDILVALSSNGLAFGIDPKTMKKIFEYTFSNKFEAFYTADVLDYDLDGNEDMIIVHDGKLSVFAVSTAGLREIKSIKVYKNFESVIVWSVRGLRK